MIPSVTADSIVGMKVRLDRDIDRAKPCCDNIAIIHPGKAPHAGEFRCATCNSHRGWAAKSTIDFIVSVIGRFGAPADLITIRHQERSAMSNYEQKDDTASIFVNDRKTEDKHPDSTGTAKIDGVEYYVSAWRRVSKSGKPYLSMAFKKKQEAVDRSKPRAEVFNDSIGF
jgi:hypothetical protein